VASHTPELLLTTGQAAELIGRSPYAIRNALRSGALQSAERTDQGQHRLRPTDVLAWDRSHPAKAMPLRRPWEQTAIALNTLGGEASAEELAVYLHLHTGNVRKHLLVLEADGRAERHADGQWGLIVRSRVGAA
jgi:hypothetical protein